MSVARMYGGTGSCASSSRIASEYASSPVAQPALHARTACRGPRRSSTCGRTTSRMNSNWSGSRKKYVSSTVNSVTRSSSTAPSLRQERSVGVEGPAARRAPWPRDTPRSTVVRRAGGKTSPVRAATVAASASNRESDHGRSITRPPRHFVPARASSTAAASAAERNVSRSWMRMRPSLRFATPATYRLRRGSPLRGRYRRGRPRAARRRDRLAAPRRARRHAPGRSTPTGSKARAGSSKRRRMSRTATTDPRTLMTPSTTAGALGSGVIVAARTTSRTASARSP